MRNDLTAAPDHFFEAGVLPCHAIHLKIDALIRHCTKRFSFGQRTKHGRAFHILPKGPWSAVVLAVLLTVPTRHIKCASIGINRRLRFGCIGAKNRRTKHKGQLHLMMIILCPWRIRQHRTTRYSMRHLLGEIPRRLAVDFIAHLSRMGGIVAPHTENASQRIKFGVTLHLKCKNFGGFE